MSAASAPTRLKLRSLTEATWRRVRRLAAIEGVMVEPGTEALAPASAADWLAQAGAVQACLAFYAAALPEREAVWWGCMGVRHASAPGGADLDCVAAAEAWVRAPGEQARASCRALVASPPGPTPTPAAILPRAVLMADLADPESILAGRFVANALERAARAVPAPAQAGTLRRRFAVSAADIAAGGAGRLPPAVAPRGSGP